jgi:curved DNA-binding protein CbpA
VLGLSPGTEPAEIKRAYRRLARAVHPDLHPQATDDQRRALAASFTQLTQAYRALLA